MADRLFEPVGVGVCVAGEGGVIETSILSDELEVPGDQIVDRQLLTVNCLQSIACRSGEEAVTIADFGDKC